MVNLWMGAFILTALSSSAQTHGRGDTGAYERRLDSLIDWEAVTAMVTAPDEIALDQIHQRIRKHSVATEATYAVSRYKLEPDMRSLDLLLACVPRNRYETHLLYQLSEGVQARAPEGPLRKAIDEVPYAYYDALGVAVVKTGKGYSEYLRLAGMLEGDVGELVASKAVELWAANPKAFDEALAGLDRNARRRTCFIFGVEPEPWLKDKRIQRLCPDQKLVIEER